MRLRHRIYGGLKTAKANVPIGGRVRLLKTAPPVDRYGSHAILDASEGNRNMLDAISKGTPITAGKIGAGELEAILKYEASGKDGEEFFRSISDRGHELNLLYVNCGVFPRDAATVASWADTYLRALGGIDLLGVWFNRGEDQIAVTYASQAAFARVRALEPFYHEIPWTQALRGKRVLVVTPFAETVALQRRRYGGGDLFPGKPEILPDFDVVVVRSPFSPALATPTHSDWHAALADLEERIGALDFDVCLVGAGAYSLPLCAFVGSELRRGAVHLGGATQLLFGIRGKRWDRHPELQPFFNENWTRPLPSERPRGTWRIEGGAYW
jgi:hypothetical protein